MTRACLCLITLLTACADEAALRWPQLPEPQRVDVAHRHREDSLTMDEGRGRFDFEVLEDSPAFVIAVEGRPSAEYLIDSLEGPDGALVRPDGDGSTALGAAEGPFQSPNRSVGDHGGATLLVPNNPWLRLSPGPWTMTLLSNETDRHTVALRRVEQLASARPAQLRIPLTVHTTGDLDAEHPRIMRAMEQLRRIVAAAGVVLSPLEFVAIDEGFSVLEGSDLRSEQALAMLALAGGSEGLPLFVIERFMVDGEPFSSVGGVSAALPADPKAGAPLSGVVVATSFSSDDPDEDTLGLVMAHEIGHALGLFHSEEASGFEDSLDDTPVGEGSNLMHHRSRPGFETLSPQQGMVMRSHPLGRWP